MLTGAAAFAAQSFVGRLVHARGRTPVGGKLSLRVPWAVSTIDPHRIDDPFAAIFGGALFDTLYAQTADRPIVPMLAETAPEPDGASLRVKLRADLRTANDRPFSTKDAAWSIARSRGSGGGGWLADIPSPRVDGHDLVFAMKDASRLVRALASPIVAMVPRGFSPEAPDGTGPFRFGSADGATLFRRNSRAAMGPAFIDEMNVRAAATVEASMLAFESGTDDIGWFERGLHEPRAGSERFDYGTVGWAVLYTGRDARDWDSPGVAQRVGNGIPYARLKNLHIGSEWPTEPELGWGGPPVQLLVRSDAPWMLELANAVAATISRPSHEVTVKTVSAAELSSRRSSRTFGLALEVVRAISAESLGAMIALATSDNPVRAQEITQHPPKLADVSPRTMTRTLRAGVIAEIRVVGGRASDRHRELVLAPSNTGFGFDLGASFLRAKRA